MQCSRLTWDYPKATPDEALATSALLVQDDLVIMVKNDGETWFLLLGSDLVFVLIRYRRGISP